MNRPPILPDLPTLHPRHHVVEAGRRTISLAVVEAMKTLTRAELLSVLAGEMASVAKYAIREERKA